MKISLAEINSKVGDLKYNANLIKKHADIAIKNGAKVIDRRLCYEKQCLPQIKNLFNLRYNLHTNIYIIIML